MSKKRSGIFAFMLVMLALGSVVFAACARPGSSSTANAGSNSSSSSGPATVHMGATNFEQSTVTLSKGSKLTLTDDAASLHIIKNGMWDNSSPKTVQETGAPAVNITFNGNDSNDIGPFTTAGTYHIFCTVHLNMNLTITVK